MSILMYNLDISQFNDKFSDNDKCLKYLAELKWQDGFKCRKCGHTNFCKGKSSYSRRCTKCKSEESATAHTIFHHCKIDIVDAFQIAYSVCKEPGISTYELSKKLEYRQMTCWKFKKKIIDCVEQEGDLKLFDFQG
ncbi:MAG: transposase [Bacteroidetes bacterium]|nr:transposase [Bacteroidota bacterium]